MDLNERTQLTHWIKERGLALGFGQVGILPVPELHQPGEKLKQWLGLNYQAEMEWMVTHLEKRLQPGSLMDNTRSIVCVTLNYYNPDLPNPHPDAVKIAKYARGTDYHYVLKDRLKQLLAEVQAKYPTINGRALTDSAPILEKALAVQAGLGWQGKHSNLITRNQGSWVFLGELLLDVELVDDIKPVPDLCGRCSRCIDACPTDAITQPYVVDANRCISYWTIEYKGETFPESIAQNLNGWVFGCDICQDVCPWNHKLATETIEPLFQPRPHNQTPSAHELLTIDEETFKEHYRKSPIKRAKLTGLKRNITSLYFDSLI